jgi:hypothetical protein
MRQATSGEGGDKVGHWNAGALLGEGGVKTGQWIGCSFWGERPGMFIVEVYAAVRRFVFTEGRSRREAARVFGLSRETVLRMCRFSLPPG